MWLPVSILRYFSLPLWGWIKRTVAIVSTVLKKAEEGDTRFPHMFPVFLKNRWCQALSPSVRNILQEYLHIWQVLHDSDHHELGKEIVYLDIDMSRSITISRIFAYHNTWRVILPYDCGFLLRMTKPLQNLTKVYYFLVSLTCSHKLCFAAA